MWTDFKWSEQELDAWLNDAAVHSSGRTHLDPLQVPWGHCKEELHSTPSISGCKEKEFEEKGKKKESVAW